MQIIEKLNSLSILIFIALFQTTFSGFTKIYEDVCYSVCPRNNSGTDYKSREEIDKQWLQCLKDCHKISEWKIVILVAAMIFVLLITVAIVYICCGQSLKRKYIFHKQRNKRFPIINVQQTIIKEFQTTVEEFKKLMIQKSNNYVIEFENDSNSKKIFTIQEAVFDQPKSTSFQQLFYINLLNKNIIKKQSIFQNASISIDVQSETQLSQEKQSYSQLIGAISLTTKGINLWWIKIDDKPSHEKKCKCWKRRNQKYYSVYERDPFAHQNSFIGNVVLEDGSKQPENRYAKYFIKEKIELLESEQNIKQNINKI